MRLRLLLTALILLAAYTASLLTVELCTSQAYVRHYFTDITGPVPFYAVNTTLSVFLQWGTALLFGVCAAWTSSRRRRRSAHWFCVSQVLVFAYLGADDRFMIHETVGGWLGIGDHYVLAAVAALEVALLITLARGVVPRRGWRWLAGAAALFAVMMVFDAKVPHDMTLRLSLEDLAKTWSCLCFLLFAWETLQQRVALLIEGSAEVDVVPLGQVCYPPAKHSTTSVAV